MKILLLKSLNSLRKNKDIVVLAADKNFVQLF